MMRGSAETVRADEALLEVARGRARDGWLVVTLADEPYLPVLLNWLVAMDRIGVENLLVVTLDAAAYAYLRGRDFPTALVDTPRARASIWTTKVRVMESLVRGGLSVIYSDADAVWLRDPRGILCDDRAAQLTVTEGTYWPPEAYAAWGFVACAGFVALRGEPATVAFLERWRRDVGRTGDDQVSLNGLLMADGLRWVPGEADRRVRHFRGRDFVTFDEPVVGTCAAAPLRVRLLPHALFQRVPEPAGAPYVVHYLGDLAGRAETQALTGTGSWFLADDWRDVEFHAPTIRRVSVERVPPPPERIVVAAHHKSGTLYAYRVFHEIARALGWVLWVMEGIKPRDDWHVGFHANATVERLAAGIRDPCRIAHFVRHPKAMIVSGARYHVDARESWLDAPRRELRGRTYREAIAALPTERERVRFEMHHAARQHILDMVAVHDARRRLPLVTVRLEDVSHDRSGRACRTFLEFLGFEGRALEIAAGFATRRALWAMDDLPAHARTGVDDSWREIFDDELDREFSALFGDAAERLGYR